MSYFLRHDRANFGLINLHTASEKVSHFPTDRNGKLTVNLDTADGGQTTGIAGVTEKKSGWILKQKWSWSGDDYTIVDDQKNPVFKVSGKAFSHRNGMLFLDTNGEKIAYLCKKYFTLRPTYKLFTFTPNYEGQESTDKQKIKDTEFPLYRYAYIDQKLMSLVGEYYFKRYVTNDQKEEVWQAKGKFSLKMKLDVKKSDTKEVIAQIGQTSFFQFEAASE